MSIKILSYVWAHGPDDKAQLLVLLALADYADDDGMCWPSVGKIGEKARMSERNARRILRDLEAGGLVTSDVGGGRSGCSQYTIIMTENPDKMSPRTKCPPGQNAHKTRTKRAQNPDIAMSAEPSITIREPSKSKVTREADDIAMILEAWASPAAVASFIAYRRKTKGGAMTLTAAKRMAENLKAIFNAGGDADDALGMAEERAWLTIKPDWYFNAKNATSGNGSGNGHGRNHDAGETPGDRELRIIAAAARTLSA